MIFEKKQPTPDRILRIELPDEPPTAKIAMVCSVVDKDGNLLPPEDQELGYFKGSFQNKFQQGTNIELKTRADFVQLVQNPDRVHRLTFVLEPLKPDVTAATLYSDIETIAKWLGFSKNPKAKLMPPAKPNMAWTSLN